MGYIRLESVNPSENRFRNYVVCWNPTLWGTWGVYCLWGRIGQNPHGSRLQECADHDTALSLAAEVVELRMKHGYVAKWTSNTTDQFVGSDEDWFQATAG
jgi:predicted DNA-binding WGR domain protein